MSTPIPPLPPGLMDELLSTLSQITRIHLLTSTLQQHQQQQQPSQSQHELNSLQQFIFANITVIDIGSPDPIEQLDAIKLNELLQSPSLSNISTIQMGRGFFHSQCSPRSPPSVDDLLGYLQQSKQQQQQPHQSVGYNDNVYISSYHLLITIIHSSYFSSLKTLSLDKPFREVVFPVVDHARDFLFKSFSESTHLVGLEQLTIEGNLITEKDLSLLFGPHLAQLGKNETISSTTPSTTPTTLPTTPVIAPTFGSNLESLNITCKHDCISSEMADIICQLTNLTCLTLCGDGYGQTESQIYQQIINSLHSLEKLIICPSGDVDFTTLQPTTQLQELSLSGENFENLCKSQFFTKLTHLTIQHWDSSLEIFLPHPSTLSNLKYLDLSYNHLSDEDLLTLSQCVWLKGVEELKLNLGQCFTSIGLSSLISSPYLSNLKSLHLDRVLGLDIECCRSIAESKYLNKLERLSLDHNELSTNSINILVSSPNLSNLTHLSLRLCGLTSSALEYIINSDYMNHLEYLDLSWNNIDDDGVNLLLDLSLSVSNDYNNSALYNAESSLPSHHRANIRSNNTNSANITTSYYKPRLTNVKWINLDINLHETFGDVGSVRGKQLSCHSIPAFSFPRSSNATIIAEDVWKWYPVWCRDNVNGYFYLAVEGEQVLD